MNQVYCPECETELTKSIVGYLCHGCGSMHGFENMSSTAFPTAGNSVAINDPIESSFAPEQASIHDDKTASVKQSSIRHHVNKLLVPKISELQKPIAEDHLLSAHITDDNAIKTDEILAYEPPSASEKMKEEFSTDTASHALDDSQTDSTTTSKTSRSNLLPVVIIVAMITAIATLLAYFLLVR